MIDNIIKKTYIAAFDNNDKALNDLIIINTKCLIDDIKQRYVYIDNNRLKNELIYNRFYSEGLKTNNILNILLPVIISNTNIKKSEEVCVDLIDKYIKFLKKEEKIYEYIFGAVVYNSILHDIIQNKDIKYEDLLQNAKKNIIGFNIDLDKSNVVKFQMDKIKVIQKIDKYIDSKIEEYNFNDVLSSLLNILYDVYVENREAKDSGVVSMKKSILSILSFNQNLNINNTDFILSMSEYIIKLRRYKINKKVYVKNADPRALIKLDVGESALDSIFNKIEVVSKNFNNGVLELGIKSKSGLYVMKFKKS